MGLHQIASATIALAGPCVRKPLSRQQETMRCGGRLSTEPTSQMLLSHEVFTTTRRLRSAWMLIIKRDHSPEMIPNISFRDRLRNEAIFRCFYLPKLQVNPSLWHTDCLLSHYKSKNSLFLFRNEANMINTRPKIALFLPRLKLWSPRTTASNRFTTPAKIHGESTE